MLEPTPVTPAHRVGPVARRRRPPGLATIAVVAVVGLLLVGWVAAAVFAVLRMVELAAVALAAGWVGYGLGVRRGRSGPGRR